MIFLAEFSSSMDPKWPAGDCSVLKFFWRSVNGKYFMRFQNENTIFLFLRRSAQSYVAKVVHHFSLATSVLK